MSRPFSPRNSSPASFVRVNGKIRAREVRVIGVDGKQLGVIPLTDALNQARQHGLDLVEIAATATPAADQPVAVEFQQNGLQKFFGQVLALGNITHQEQAVAFFARQKFAS